MKHYGAADLPLHNGHVPVWLAERMAKLGLAITESIIAEYGRSAFLQKLSDPFWFQSLGAVMGMDWHSSGITTSVVGALKKAINPHAKTLGIYICGGRGKHSRQTPAELLRVGDQTGLDAHHLVKCSKLSAKVDNTAVQDGFQLYLHSFFVSTEGEWAVIQQGMNGVTATARRYHWHSEQLASFINEPHTAICGLNPGVILNVTDHKANAARDAIMQIAQEPPEKMIREIQLILPSHHDVHSKDVDLKRLGTILWLAREKQPPAFEDLLLMEGLGPRTLQSLALVSEVIHGTAARFKDPARFAFAHGGKDGHPFPVPVKVYDETISVLQKAVQQSKLGNSDKQEAIKKLHEVAVKAEQDFIPNNRLEALIEQERNDSWKYGGKTVFGDALPPENISPVQLRLF